MVDRFDSGVLGYTHNEFKANHRHHTGVSVVDDAEFTLMGPANQIVGVIGPRAIQIASDASSSHAMELSCNRGKSNYVFRFFGEHATEERIHLEATMGNKIPFQHVNGNWSSVDAVDIYTRNLALVAPATLRSLLEWL